MLSGPVGTGKTHLLAATLAHLVLEVGVQARYVEISLLYATIRRGFQEGKSGGEIIGPLSEVEVLAIDELGKGRGSPFEMETMDELIARRYNAHRTTLFATNYSLESERKNGAHGGGLPRHRGREDGGARGGAAARARGRAHLQPAVRDVHLRGAAQGHAGPAPRPAGDGTSHSAALAGIRASR